jgi:uncharacterized membrane protein YraQ (UPF0718 family)
MQEAGLTSSDIVQFIFILLVVGMGIGSLIYVVIKDKK